MPQAKAHKVNERSPWLAEDDQAHALATALRKGVPAMREAARRGEFMRPNEGELELVPLGGDPDLEANYEGVSLAASDRSEFTIYDLRVDRSTMPNVWADSIRDTARLPFRSRIILKGWDTELAGETITDEDGEVTSDVQGWVDNLDGEGRSLDEWAAEAFEHALFEGIAFGFVDNDPRSFPDPESRRRHGARPYCTLIRRKDLQWMILETGPSMVPRIRAVAFNQPIREVSVDDPNAWMDETTPAIKVVIAGEETLDPETGRLLRSTPVRVRVYVEQQNGEYEHDPARDAEIRPENPLDRLIDVPLIPLYGKRLGPWRGESPYLDSATMQQAIWVHCSEMQQKARDVALGWLHESGVGGQLPNASQSVQRANPNMRYRSSTEPNAKLTIVESRGETLKELRALVEWFSQQIQSSHNQIRSERPTAPVTAREITLEGVQASSALEMMVVFQERAWKLILDLMALLGGLGARGTVEIPHDFGLPNAGIQRNHELFMVGKMTAKNHWTEKVRAGDVHETEFDLEAEIEMEKAGREMEAREAAEAIGAAIRYGASAEANAAAPPPEPEESEEPEEAAS